MDYVRILTITYGFDRVQCVLHDFSTLFGVGEVDQLPRKSLEYSAEQVHGQPSPRFWKLTEND